MPHDDELTVSLIKRVHNSGVASCIFTTDTWQLGWRHDDIATTNYAFYRGMSPDLGLTDPVFQKRLKDAGIDPEKDPEKRLVDGSMSTSGTEGRSAGRRSPG